MSAVLAPKPERNAIPLMLAGGTFCAQLMEPNLAMGNNRTNLFRLARLVPLITGAALVLAACSNSFLINDGTKFSSSEYGVSASPRLITSGSVPKGGGRYVVGQPYRVAGNWYYPEENTRYDKTGTASWYGPNFHGRQTANGEIFDQFALTAAHPTLPLPSYVRVLNLNNGRSTIVRVNDRGPFANGRLIDLSRRTAQVLGFIEDGTARVRVTYIGRAPVEGDDTRYLVASINVPDGVVPPQSPRSGSSIISRQSGGLLGSLASLFSYVEPASGATTPRGEVLINQAHAAALTVASQVPQLDAWKAGIQTEPAALDLAIDTIEIGTIEIGTFVDKALANEIARRFAFLAAVETSEVSQETGPATRLVINYLKPGVTLEDISAIGEELGLDHIAAHN